MKHRFSKTTVLISVACALILLGLFLLILLPKQSFAVCEPIVFDLSKEDMRLLSFDISDCEIILRQGETSSIVATGFYREELQFVRENGSISLKESTSLFGIGAVPVGVVTYWQHKTPQDERKIEITLSPDDSYLPLSFALQNTVVDFSGSFYHMSLTAVNSEIDMSIEAFHDIRVDLDQCKTNFHIFRSLDSFSRLIESFDCDFSFNGETAVNSDSYQAAEADDILKLRLQGGSADIAIDRS